MKRTMPLLTGTLSLLICLSLCPANMFGQLWKKHSFSFHHAQDSVTCIYNSKTNELIVSGFETDGKGTFYFLGGDPLSVTCFQHGRLAYRRSLGCQLSGMLTFRLVGDSLCLIHRENHKMYRVHKDNKGPVETFPLKAAPRFWSCWSNRQSFTLQYIIDNGMSISRTYDFRQQLLQEITYKTGEYQKHDVNYQQVPDNFRLEFHGRHQDYRLFMADLATVLLLDDAGNIVRQTSLSEDELGWCVLSCRPDTRENWGDTSDLRIFRNGHFYIPCFNEKKELYVWELDVNRLLAEPSPQAAAKL